MLAKNAPAPRSSRMNALSLTFFASKLAPTRVLGFAPLPHLFRSPPNVVAHPKILAKLDLLLRSSGTHCAAAYSGYVPK
ncbi:hypothetical protein DK871_20440 [Pseudomonas sp. L13]|nr:hypothetical protein [Pseudomonas sp. L13]